MKRRNFIYASRSSFVRGILTGLCLWSSSRGYCATGAAMVVVWDNNMTPLHMFEAQGKKLIPLNEMILLGLAPRYFPKTGQFTLTAPKWQLKGQVGRRNYILNGISAQFPVAPRLVKWELVAGLTLPNIPFIPLEEIARKRGYAFTQSGYTQQLRAPHATPATPVTKFGWQEVVAPRSQTQGSLRVESGLSLGSTGGYLVFEIANNGKKEYQASKLYMFVELSDGTILSGDDTGGSSGQNFGEMIKPRMSAHVQSDPLYFPAGRAFGIRRLIYADGEYFFEWQVKEYQPVSK